MFLVWFGVAALRDVTNVSASCMPTDNLPLHEPVLSCIVFHSYKLWYKYLCERRKDVQNCSPSDAVRKDVNNCFERALVGHTALAYVHE
jgi:hypothetical protein